MSTATLEDAIIDAITESLTEDEIEDAKIYFKGVTINEMIDQAFEE